MSNFFLSIFLFLSESRTPQVDHLGDDGEKGTPNRRKGQLACGHYVAKVLCNNAVDGRRRWLLFDDTMVGGLPMVDGCASNGSGEDDEGHVNGRPRSSPVTRDSYLLFYHRRCST